MSRESRSYLFCQKRSYLFVKKEAIFFVKKEAIFFVKKEAIFLKMFGNYSIRLKNQGSDLWKLGKLNGDVQREGDDDLQDDDECPKRYT